MPCLSDRVLLMTMNELRSEWFWTRASGRILSTLWLMTLLMILVAAIVRRALRIVRVYGFTPLRLEFGRQFNLRLLIVQSGWNMTIPWRRWCLRIVLRFVDSVSVSPFALVWLFNDRTLMSGLSSRLRVTCRLVSCLRSLNVLWLLCIKCIRPFLAIWLSVDLPLSAKTSFAR